MDTLTHALSGALAARATEPKTPRPDQLPRRVRLWVGFWAAAFPDSDFATLLIDPLTYLNAHRGITHSVVMLPLWAAVLAAAFVWVWRRQYSWRAYVGVCALGIGIHIAGDVITAFGTMILAPFSDWRAQLPFAFIIDPYFSGIIVAALLASLLWRDVRTPAIAGLAVLAMYVGFQALLRERALDHARAYVAREGLRGAGVHALPQPFSPFHWMLVVQETDAYRLAYVSLLRREAADAPPEAFWLARVHASYRPLAQAEWWRVARYGELPMEVALAEEVWHLESFARYRRFTMFPALYRVERARDYTCVWFNDLRFALVGRTMPFRYGACNDPPATAGAARAWRIYRMVTDDGGREMRAALPGL
jgi:inner membrane protein